MDNKETHKVIMEAVDRMSKTSGFMVHMVNNGLDIKDYFDWMDAIRSEGEKVGQNDQR